MAIPTFIQNSRINQVIYQIRDGHLLVSARPLIGPFKEYRIDLHGLDPDYQPHITRDYALVLLPLVLFLLCAGAIWVVLNKTSMPGEMAFPLIQWPVIGCAVFLLAAIRGSRRIEYFQFNNRWGKPALTIIREREQAEECAAFIATLVGHIEITQSDLSPADRAMLLRRLEQDNPIGPTIEAAVPLWPLSLAVGALAAGLPLVPRIDFYFSGALFPLVFMLCVCGCALSVFSFLNNEPKRWWSAPGFVLSLIPVFFYH